MDQLSSCYFCGGALDVSLSEYPVVPSELRADGEASKSVVLCSTCRQKLATVVEEVVAATADVDEATDTDSTEAERAAFEPLDSEGDVEPEADATRPPDGDTAATAGEGALLGGEEGTESGGTATRASAPRGTTDDDTDAPTSDIADKSAADHSGPSLTRLEYNKVMRLLQNRPFPVDRAEIQDVATNAYQISPEEFDAVIDAAVDRGLIAERDGQFVRPE